MTSEATDIVAGTLLVLSGPPGSGKTTIARALADAAERSTVHLVTDLFYVAIAKGFVPPFLPEAAKQNAVVLDVIVDAMVGYAKVGTTSSSTASSARGRCRSSFAVPLAQGSTCCSPC